MGMNQNSACLSSMPVGRLCGSQQQPRIQPRQTRAFALTPTFPTLMLTLTPTPTFIVQI